MFGQAWPCVFLRVLLTSSWPSPEVISGGKRWRFVGNHRYEIRIGADTEAHAAYTVKLPWRRGDQFPEKKGTVLVDANSTQPVARCRRLVATNEEGRFAFSGRPGGFYHLYYMPFETCEFAGGKCEFGQIDEVEGMVQYEAFAGSCNDTRWWQEGDVAELEPGERQARTQFDAFGAKMALTALH